MAKTFIITSVVGGFWLWVAAASYGDKAGGAVILLFFIAIPLAVIISFLITLITIAPLWFVVRRIRWVNPAFFSLLLALLPAIVFPGIGMYSNVPDALGKVKACWWAIIWLGGMGAIYSTLTKALQSRPERAQGKEGSKVDHP